jgi:ABC-type bacteriocin/lantibiotic exporter with double-glycine peptidase domain
MGTQSKLNSILESLSNTAIGLLTTLIFSPIIYSMVGMTYTYSQLGLVTILFTALSIVRGYIIRRFFNKKPN